MVLVKRKGRWVVLAVKLNLALFSWASVGEGYVLWLGEAGVYSVSSLSQEWQVINLKGGVP